MNPKNHILNGWFDFFNHHNTKANFCRNFKFGIAHLCHMYKLLETFNEDRKKFFVQGHKNNSITLRFMIGLSY